MVLPMRPLHTAFCILLLCLFLLAGCGSSSNTQGGLLDFVNPVSEETGPSPLITGDPAGPIPAPSIPADLIATAKALEEASQDDPADSRAEADSDNEADAAQSSGKKETPRVPSISYTLRVVAPPTAPELATAFESLCLLNRLKEQPLYSVAGLTQRLRSDINTAKEVLHSYGYYAGTASGRIRSSSEDRAEESDNGGGRGRKQNAPRARVVTVTFEPGEQYTIGRTSIRVKDPAKLPPDETADARRALPKNLDTLGLAPGTPAVADTVLNATGQVREAFRDRGYPSASIFQTRYTVDHATKTLDADVVVDSGNRVLMGPLEIVGTQNVSYRYLDALRTWRPGQAWNQSRIENYRDALRNSGLFVSAEIRPGKTALENGQHPVVAELQPAPERTMGGALRYDSDFGPGVQGYWEHRNFTGNGDRLRLDAPIWRDMQELALQYRLPFFLRTDQDLILRGGVLKEETDAHNLKSMSASIGLERRLSRRMQGSLSLLTEGGDLETPEEARHKYFMVGFPVSFAWNNANNLLDATKGFKFKLDAAPYIGTYDTEFSTLRARIEGNAYIPLVGKDTFVFALRAVYGTLVGANSYEVPSSLRFYTGGGGSVRGYEYQSLGPRNKANESLGGSSAVEMSAEARVKFTDTFGAVAFIDGGMAYESTTPSFGEDIRWGAGLGLRVYTAIGPIRLDVATPLNPRSDDGSVQVYFSIGQSF